MVEGRSSVVVLLVVRWDDGGRIRNIVLRPVNSCFSFLLWNRRRIFSRPKSSKVNCRLNIFIYEWRKLDDISGLHPEWPSRNNRVTHTYISAMDPVLYTAAVEGDIEVLRQNADKLEVQVTHNKKTVLHVAAEFGQTRCLEEILNKCGRSLLCSENSRGETSLQIAAREGHIGAVQSLIQYAKTVEEEVHEIRSETTKEMLLRMNNMEGDTALYEAVRNNHLCVVEILTEEDPEFLHPPNKAGETPLYLAAERGYPNIVSKILDNCTSPAYSGPDGRTALHAATICDNLECIKILQRWKSSLSKEADVYGRTPLHYSAWHGNLWACRELLDLDNLAAYLPAESDDNNTAIHTAASKGHVNVMEELLSRCPDCWDMINNKGQNILHVAVEHQQDEAIKYILGNSSLNSLKNQKDGDGNTPIKLLTKKPSNHNYGLLADFREDKKKKATGVEVLPGDKLKVEQEMDLGRKKLRKRNSKIIEERWRKENYMTKIGNTHLIVVTLIATVTFAAGFTIPGGYDENIGPRHGMAVLTRRVAFKAFVLADTVALVFSLTAVFLHLIASIYEDEVKIIRHYRWALLLILAAMEAMLVAFMTGLSVVLAHSRGLAIMVYLISCFFFPISCFVVWKAYRDLSKGRA